MGWWRLIVLYLSCGAAAGVVQVVPFPTSMIPIVGASGAVAGVMSASVVLGPTFHARTVMFGAWFVLQLVQGLNAMDASQQWTGGVAGWAHLGGLLAGGILSLFWLLVAVVGKQAFGHLRNLAASAGLRIRRLLAVSSTPFARRSSGLRALRRKPV